MSISKNRKARIIDYMLEKITRTENCVEKVSETFNISHTTVYKYLKELEKDKIIEKKKRGEYKLVEHTYIFDYENVGLDEDSVFQRDIAPIIADLPENVKRIWQYSFTEMFNNAIEHSNSKVIGCYVARSYAETAIMIADNGMGIFEKIREYFNYASLDDVISELFKGKLTTDTKNHSGEGIFFTSRLMDYFSAISSKKMFSHNNHNDIYETLQENAELYKLTQGTATIIYMRLANRSHKQIVEVFDMFADVDGGFNKTSVPMKNVFGNNFPVSRSQAKRLYNRFEKFKEVELDFDGVDEIGQSFAHELFVKFASNNPDTAIVIKNANEKVNNMIKHVKNTI